jgi:uncharacterized RDD family membrane protein YckC
VNSSAYAGIVSRLVALGLDAIAITLSVLAVTTLPVVIWQDVAPIGAPGWLATACAVAGLFVPWVYFTFYWWLTGQTPGGLATGIVVEHRDGHRMSLPHAALRAGIGLLLAPVCLVGMLAVLSDSRRRAWHDRLLRTDVRYAAAR